MVVKIIIILFLFFQCNLAYAQKMYSLMGGTSGMKGIAMSASYDIPFKTKIDTMNELVLKSTIISSSSINYEFKNLIGNNYYSISASTGAILKLIDHEKNSYNWNKKLDLYTGLKFYGQYFNDNIILNERNASNLSLGIKPIIELDYVYTNRTNIIIKFEQDIILVNKEFGNNYFLFMGFKIKI